MRKEISKKAYLQTTGWSGPTKPLFELPDALATDNDFLVKSDGRCHLQAAVGVHEDVFDGIDVNDESPIGRFSKARAKILFSESAIVSPYRGITGFKFRIANMRRNNLIEMSAKVLYSYIRWEDGVEKRRYLQLPLEIDFINLFPLPWTIVHPIDDDSPLWGKHVLDLTREEAEFVIIVKGYDDTFNQYVHQVHSYKHDEVMFDVDFQPMFEALHGATEIDLDKISDFRKVNKG